MTPLVSPGMPCTRVTLLLAKYSLQVALSSDPLQNSFHSLVVTVTLSIISVLRHLSKLWFCRVRFPNMQTLHRGKKIIVRHLNMIHYFSVRVLQLLSNKAKICIFCLLKIIHTEKYGCMPTCYLHKPLWLADKANLIPLWHKMVQFNTRRRNWRIYNVNWTHGKSGGSKMVLMTPA